MAKNEKRNGLRKLWKNADWEELNKRIKNDRESLEILVDIIIRATEITTELNKEFWSEFEKIDTSYDKNKVVVDKLKEFLEEEKKKEVISIIAKELLNNRAVHQQLAETINDQTLKEKFNNAVKGKQSKELITLIGEELILIKEFQEKFKQIINTKAIDKTKHNSRRIKIYRFIDAADKKRRIMLVDAACKIDNPRYMLDYARSIKENETEENRETLKKILKAILEIGNKEENYRLITFLTFFVKDHLLEEILEIGDPRLIYTIAVETKYLSEEMLDVILESKDSKYIYYIAAKMPSIQEDRARMDKIIKTVLETKDVFLMFMFVENFENIPKNILLQEINKLIDDECKYSLVGQTGELTKESLKQLIFFPLAEVSRYVELEPCDYERVTNEYYEEKFSEDLECYEERMADLLDDYKKSGMPNVTKYIFDYLHVEKVFSHEGRKRQ